jgi:hypothetical protein
MDSQQRQALVAGIIMVLVSLVLIVSIIKGETNMSVENVMKVSVSVPEDAKKELVEILANNYVRAVLDGKSRSESSNAAFQAATKAGWVWDEKNDEWTKKKAIKIKTGVK